MSYAALLSWHGIFPSCQEPEEPSTSFF